MTEAPAYPEHADIEPEALEPAARRDRGAGLSDAARQLLDAVGPAIQRRNYAIAIRGLTALTALAPDHPEVLRMQAVVLHAQRRFVDAARLLERAREQWPDDALIENNLGSALGDAGDVEGALAAMRRSTELAPDIATTWFNLGRSLDLNAQSEAALVALTRALECNPKHVSSRILLARTLQLMGRIDEAIGEFRQAIAHDPRSAKAWFSLSGIRTLRFDVEDTAALALLYADASLGADDRIFAGFALAKALEDQNRPAEAFAILATANASRRRQVTWDAADFSGHVDAIEKAYPQPAAVAGTGGLGDGVIFIVSMPRSGSTLVEQILAAHPLVEGANELADLPATLNEESVRRSVNFPHWVQQMDRDDWERLGRRYLDRTARWRETHAIFTDKGLTNWLYIGSALAMLPGARFVNCRRDPLETCLSCYRQLFAQEQGYTYDFHELAAFHRDHARLMRHWHRQFPGQIHDLAYEDLVADPESEIRRLLDFCGLEFDPACLRFHEARRTVRTASAAQVREPLRSDTARADRFGALLAPVRRMLAAMQAGLPQSN